jgi:hypothetical protein
MSNTVENVLACSGSFIDSRYESREGVGGEEAINSDK